MFLVLCRQALPITSSSFCPCPQGVASGDGSSGEEVRTDCTLSRIHPLASVTWWSTMASNDMGLKKHLRREEIERF